MHTHVHVLVLVKTVQFFWILLQTSEHIPNSTSVMHWGDAACQSDPHTLLVPCLTRKQDKIDPSSQKACCLIFISIHFNFSLVAKKCSEEFGKFDM